MSIAERIFGTVNISENEKREAKLYSLALGDVRVDLTDYGARIVSVVVPDKNNNYADVVLGYDTAEEYATQSGFLGAFVGRHANRIANAEFVLNGKRYELAKNEKKYARPNSIHGGVWGFDKKVWDVEPLDSGECKCGCGCANKNVTGLRFKCYSPDGEEGFPGALDVEAIYTLARDEDGAVSLRLDMCAKFTDKDNKLDTLANFTNHVYFNLAGHDCGVVHDAGGKASGGILAHKLKLASRFYTPTDECLCPTGEILAATGSLDFHSGDGRVIGQDIDSGDPRLAAAKGYDHNFVLDKSERGALELAATLESPESGRKLEMFTTMPGVQVYTSNGLRSRNGKNGAHYDLRQGVCLEPQVFPNAMANTHFPSPILRVGHKYHEVVIWKFSAK